MHSLRNYIFWIKDMSKSLQWWKAIQVGSMRKTSILSLGINMSEKTCKCEECGKVISRYEQITRKITMGRSNVVAMNVEKLHLSWITSNSSAKNHTDTKNVINDFSNQNYSPPQDSHQCNNLIMWKMCRVFNKIIKMKI